MGWTQYVVRISMTDDLKMLNAIIPDLSISY